jgi:hypothetical protein
MDSGLEAAASLTCGSTGKLGIIGALMAEHIRPKEESFARNGSEIAFYIPKSSTKTPRTLSPLDPHVWPGVDLAETSVTEFHFRAAGLSSPSHA